MTALQPKGARESLFQSYGPYRISYVNLVGSILDALIMFEQYNTCGVRRSQSWRGKLESVVASAAIKASLNIWMASQEAKVDLIIFNFTEQFVLLLDLLIITCVKFNFMYKIYFYTVQLNFTEQFVLPSGTLFKHWSTTCCLVNGKLKVLSR
jgi:hypothetical protein